MRIARKRGVRGIRIIEHNRVLFWIIVFLLLVLLAVIFSIKQIGNNKSIADSGNNKNITGSGNNSIECMKDSDCAAASCCHPSSCVPSNQAPECKGLYCSMECKPGTLDCGQGECKCSKNKCMAAITE